MDIDLYKRLAQHLDALPNGFPSTADGSELKVLAKLFTPDEAELAAELTSVLETAEEIAGRTGRSMPGLRKQLKALARRGLIDVGRKNGVLGFQSMPFIVGIYEMQGAALDAELARLVEDYFHSGFGQMLGVEPQFHRVVPLHDAIRSAIDVRPFESASEIVNSMQSWAVQDCMCRKQKALIGQACEHQLENCMIMDPRPNIFEDVRPFRVLNRDEALATLRSAAEAGLVHTVSNSVEGTFYICNCCTCSCGILRGMADFGIANVVASSAFVNQVDDLLCNGCEACIEPCQFNALSMDDALAKVDYDRCVGCGVCVIACPRDALGLVRRPEEEVKPVPQTPADWRLQRLAARGL